MKNEYTKNNTLPLNVLLEETRKQGTKDVSKPCFYVICTVIAISLIGTIGILYSLGLDFIEENLAIGQWLIGLLLLSVLLGLVTKYFLRMSLLLWKMTKEEDEDDNTKSMRL